MMMPIFHHKNFRYQVFKYQSFKYQSFKYQALKYQTLKYQTLDCRHSRAKPYMFHVHIQMRLFTIICVFISLTFHCVFIHAQSKSNLESKPINLKSYLNPQAHIQESSPLTIQTNSTIQPCDMIPFTPFEYSEPFTLKPQAYDQADLSRFVIVPLTHGDTRFVYAVDAHVHTLDHSPTPKRTPVHQIMSVARQKKVDIVFITDHMSSHATALIDRYHLNRKALPRLYAGSEEGSQDGHLGVWNIANRYQIRKSSTFKELITEVHRVSPLSLRVLNHPGWQKVGAKHYNQYTFDPRLSAKSSVAQAIEIMNGSAFLRFTSLSLIPQWERFLAQGIQLPLVGGSDAHQAQGVGRVLTMVAARNPQAHSVIEAVKEGRTYVTDDATLYWRVNHAYIGDTLLLTSSKQDIHIEYAVQSNQGGRLEIFHNQQRIHVVTLVPGCWGQTLKVPRGQVFNDGYFRVQLIRQERSNGYVAVPNQEREQELKYKTRMKNHGRVHTSHRVRHRRVNKHKVDYLGLISSPIYYDLKPYHDHWYSK